MTKEWLNLFLESEADMRAAILLMDFITINDVREVLKYISLQEYIDIEQYL